MTDELIRALMIACAIVTVIVTVVYLIIVFLEEIEHRAWVREYVEAWEAVDDAEATRERGSRELGTRTCC